MADALSLDEAGADGVDGYPVGCQFQGEGLRKSDYAEFGGAVGSEAGNPSQPGR